MSKRSSYTLFIVSLVALGIFSRFIPHPPNATAIGAVALFGGFAFKNFRTSILVLFLSLFISDLALNNLVYASYNDGFVWLTSGATFIYSGFLISIVLGYFLKKKYTISGIATGSVLSVLAFFLITNAAVWASSVMYPKTFNGLMAAYAAGIPFALNQLLATVLYASVLFGAHALYTRKTPAIA